MTSAPTSSLPPFDPHDPRLLPSPYPLLAQYRTSGPVHRGVSADPAVTTWYTFGFDDSEQVLTDVATFASNPSALGRAAAVPAGWESVGHVFHRFLGGIDPPEHAQLRALLAQAFSPRQIERLRERIVYVASDLLEPTFRAPGSSFDLVADFAFPFPMVVIGEILGVDTAERTRFKDASTAIADAIDVPTDVARAGAGSAAVTYLLEYFRYLIAQRREHPRDDVLTAMIRAAGQDENALSEEQLLAIAVELLVAGHETTVNAIAIGTLGLRDDPAAAHALATAPEPDLRGCVEELLRWTAPSQRQRARWATQRTEVGGCTIEAGDAVVVVTAAANRDPAVFDDPDTIRFDRGPNRHLTFGRGPHFCLGANLAKLELRVAMPVVAAAIGSAAVPEPDEIVWRMNTLLPGPVAVPVVMS